MRTFDSFRFSSVFGAAPDGAAFSGVSDAAPDGALVLSYSKVRTMQQLHFMRRRGSRAGFSLAELMVVIVIIGLLATMVVPRLFDRFSDAQVKKAMVDISTLGDAVTTYATMNAGRFPDSLEALVTPDGKGRTYLNQQTVPKDPWDQEYLYYPPRGGEMEPTIMTYGADRSQGGEGKDQDMTYQGIKNQEY
jgi:general secretion pathway protein G